MLKSNAARLLALSLLLLVFALPTSADILPTAYIETIVGDGTAGDSGDGGLAIDARLNRPQEIALDSAGNLYIADRFNNKVRKVDTNGIITTFAGTGTPGSSGDGGPAVDADLNMPAGVVADSQGNIYISEGFGHRVRVVDVNGVIATYAGDGQPQYGGDGGLAVNASIHSPQGLAVDSNDNVYITEFDRNRIRMVDAMTGIITTVAGNGDEGYNGDDILATEAEINDPTAILIDSSDNLYISDADNHRIRRVDATTGIITTVAGNGDEGYNGDDILATEASLNTPFGIEVDEQGNLYISDGFNFRVRRVDAVTGIITTVMGDGNANYTGDGGPAVDAQLRFPADVEITDDGSMLFSDGDAHTIRRIYNVASVSLSTPTLDFGELIEGTTSAPFTVTLTNDGGEPLEITGLTVTSGDDMFDLLSDGVSDCAVGSYASGETCDLRLTFTAMGDGLRTGTLEVATNDPTSPTTLALTGTSIPLQSYPVNLRVLTPLDVVPVVPTVSWRHQPEVDTTVAPADWYGVYLFSPNSGYTLFEWFSQADVCAGVICTASLAEYLPAWGLLSDDYQWWVGAFYLADNMMFWSGGDNYVPTTFSVTVPAPPLPANLTNDPRNGRPLITWTDDPNALWVQLYIAGASNSYTRWHERDAADNSFTCAMGVCTIGPAIDWSADGNPHQVWMQAWGPGGFSSGGTDAPNLPSWVRGDDLNLPTSTPAVPGDVALVDPTSATPTFTWTASANATWYEFVIEPVDTSWTYPIWNLGYDLGCGDGGTCTWNDPVLNNSLAAGDYVLRVRAWGPGGFSDYSADVTVTYTPN